MNIDKIIVVNKNITNSIYIIKIISNIFLNNQKTYKNIISITDLINGIKIYSMDNIKIVLIKISKLHICVIFITM